MIGFLVAFLAAEENIRPENGNGQTYTPFFDKIFFWKPLKHYEPAIYIEKNSGF